LNWKRLANQLRFGDELDTGLSKAPLPSAPPLEEFVEIEFGDVLESNKTGNEVVIDAGLAAPG
jgi:hypothetical protein